MTDAIWWSSGLANRPNELSVWSLNPAPKKPYYKSGGELAKLAESLGFPASWFTLWGDSDDRFVGVSGIGCKPIDCHESGSGLAVGGGA